VSEDLREVLQRTIASYEEERLRDAERAQAEINDLQMWLRQAQDSRTESELDLLDIIKEMLTALQEIIPKFIGGDLEEYLRTVAARAEDRLRR
jgi:hypothetical protein